MALGFGPIGGSPIGASGDGQGSPLWGRRKEIDWLVAHYRGYSRAVVVVGPHGIGKTALVREFMGRVPVRRPPLLWTAPHTPGEAAVELLGRIEELYREKTPPELIVIDEADALTDKEIERIAGRLLNLKAVRMVIFVRLERPRGPHMEVLRLSPLNSDDARKLLQSILGPGIPDDAMRVALDKAQGSPRTLSLLASVVRDHAPGEIEKLLRGEIYNLGRGLIYPAREIIAQIKPRILQVNEALVERVRLKPDSMHSLHPREFEELIAELMRGMGYEVELTPATRDGGKDIIAYMATPLGRLLCLVEAKRYRPSRPVGVELVKTLHATLNHEKANSALMVTTSSFTSGARNYQRSYEYQLGLKDFGDVIDWVQRYRRSP